MLLNRSCQGAALLSLLTIVGAASSIQPAFSQYQQYQPDGQQNQYQNQYMNMNYSANYGGPDNYAQQAANQNPQAAGQSQQPPYQSQQPEYAAQQYQGQVRKNYKPKEPTPYEIQEQAIQNSKALYGAPQESENSHSTHQRQDDPYRNSAAYTDTSTNPSQYSGCGGKASKLKSALGAAGRILGTTAAVAIPVTSMVLMTRAANRSGYNNTYSNNYGMYNSVPMGMPVNPYMNMGARPFGF